MTPPKETTIIQPALLPCPFCGAPDPATGHSFVGYWYGEVTCCDCHGEITATGNNATEATQNAITAWNTRAHPAPVEQDVERLRRALEPFAQLAQRKANYVIRPNDPIVWEAVRALAK